MIRSKIATALSSIAVMVGLSLPSVVQAETPALGWTAAHLTADPTCIRTDGTIVYAYAANAYSANGVSFTAISTSDFPCGDISWTRTSLFTGKSYTVSGVSGGYGDILSHYWSINGATQTVTLKNLTAGHRYLVQIIGCNQSNNDHNTDVYVEGFETECMRCGAAAEGWEYGGTLIGVFETIGTEYSFNLKFYNQNADWVAYNAIQVRDLSSGADPDPTTYAVSWTGGANASVDAKVDGAAISSGASVEDGKSVVFTVTPNTNYEFAEASYTDWMKSGETLTRAVTVDGAAVSITIPNATEKTTPPGPTPEHTSGPMSASGDTLCTDGDLLYAYSILGGEVSGVSFVRTIPISGGANVAFSEVVDGSKFGDFGREGDWSQYGEILSHASYWSSADSLTVELKSLTAGRKYLVQFVVHNSSADGGMTVSINSGAAQYVNGKTQSDYKYGASLVYEFTAVAATEEVELTYSGSGDRVVNAIQVRVLPGDEPTPTTYAVSWTGGANATVDVKANGSAIDSGALVGDGTNVVFTVTPNSGYEFAEASYADWTKSGDALTRTVTVNGAAVSITIPNATEKTTPPPGPTEGWTAAAMTADPSSIRKDGTLVYAYARAGVTVNTVTFTAASGTAIDNDDVSWSFTSNATAGGLAEESIADENYRNLLNTAWSLHSNTQTLTLKGLTSGKKYLVQLIGYGRNDKDAVVYVEESGDQTICMRAGNYGDDTSWPYGGTLVGVFTATSTTQVFTLKYVNPNSDWTAWNAIQVRDLSSVGPTPATYAVTWTGGANASVDVKANGSAISSGALVGDGTNVVFTVTPNTNYEFAELSYQDWTLDNGVLTRTVTVNGVAVSITIPNATEKTTPPPGPTEGWTAAAMTADPSSIRKDGVLVYAYAAGNYSANGVDFVKISGDKILNDDVSWTNTGSWGGKSCSVSDVSDAGYKDILQHSWSVNGVTQTVTLKNLTSGHKYLVQVIGCNVSGDHNTDVYVDGYPDSRMRCGGVEEGWPYGGTLVGVFTADGTTHSFDLKFYETNKDWVSWNAIQVRDISSVEPEPATYEVSWSGGNNASVVVEANGTGINSGALVGDGTNVVFTVTPNTDYEFAEASYTGWTKSGDALTRTVTVNGEAVSITIPDATAKSGPTPVEGDWYVSPDGDDSNNGKSADTPYATIAKAVSSAANGDVICVLAGNYTVTSVIDVSKAITIKGEGWDKTIVNGGSNRMFALNNAGAKLEGMKLTDSTANTRGAAVHMKDGTISWCYISGNTRSGTDFNGGAVSILKGTIDHSIFADNTSTKSGAAIGGSNPNGDILIDTCLVYGNGMASGSSGSGGIDFDNLNNVTCTIRNCTVVDNTSFGDFPAGIRVTGTGNVILINNIISGNIRDNSGKSELNLAVTRSLLDTTASRNCIITGTKDTDATYYRDAGAVSVISGSSAVVPTFVNVASGDYHLAEGSSAIAAGVTYTGIGVDLGGAAFAATPSVGCYEYSGDVPPAPTTYEVSWTGGANATVDAKANGATISSGALVGDGTNVVFTVTPNTDYEFAEASYQNWTKSGDALTRTVTVNGAAVNITIPNATEKTTPPPGPTEAWRAVAMTAYPVSVLTDGVLVYAYAWKDCIANTVEFTGARTVAGFDNENLSWTMAGNLVLDKTVEIKGVSDEGYRALLANTASCLGDPHRIVLKNLTPGHEYLVQIIGCNPTGDHDGQVTVVDYDNTVFMKSGGDGWPLGGSLIGDIVAESDTVEINLAYSGWSCFNAIQVRDLSLTDDDAVAIIERGSTTNYFFTIEDAYNGATEGETIKLVKDADFPANDPVFSKSVDIDLNGFSLTRSNLAHVKEITSDTAITNGTIAFDSGVYPADTATPFLVGSSATLTLDTLNVGDANGHEPLCLISVKDGSHVVLSGEGTYHAGSLFNSVDDGNTMTITGGRYILRGWFMPANRVYLFANYKKGTVSISGGSFSIAPDNSWIADGYRILHDINDHETPYHVVPESEAPYTESGWSYYYKDAAAAEAAHVAKRETAGGVKYYTSLRDAVSAANGSGTVTLVADIPSLDRGVTLGGTVTLDGAGHKVSVAHPYVNDSGFVANDFSFNIINIISVYPKEADVTLRNISLTGGGLLDGELSNDGLAVVDNAGTLLMENVTVTRSNGAVYNEQTGVIYMDNCRLVRNCRYCAGGLFNVTGGFAVMNRSSLSENRSLGVTGGGACENGGTLFVNNCVIVNNSSTEVGGAINNYASNHQPKLYMMNTTVSGNFSSIKDDTNAFEHDKGGAIGMRGETGAEFCAVNCLFSCNYQIDTRTDVAWGPITVSDMCSIDGGTAVKLYYSVYTGLKSMTPANTSTMEVRVINEYETSTNVFNAYFASPRVYQNAKPTAMAINGAQLVSKDDGSLDATLARYAPIKRTDNGDGTYDYGQAVYGTDGVYTYFDPSAWKNKSVAMSYAPVDTSKNAVDFFNYEAAGEMQTVDGLPNAGEEYMVTNYYESASGRSFGVAGASGWLKGDVTYYTVKLVAEPENGTVSGATINGETYEEGTVIQLTATPGYARDFLGWYEITDGGATTNFIEGSNKTVWELTVDHNYELLAKFSDLQEVLTPDPYVHVKMADDTEGPLLYPITMMTKWMRDHYENFEDTLAGKTKAEAEEWLTQILEQTSPGTGRKMWQDYVLGVDPNDADAKIWINSPQIRQEGQTAIRMEMNRLSPASGTKFTINYRLDKKLGDAATFARADVNGTGSYDVKVENDPTGLYVIDLLFIPEGKSTSEEYVTTVNTAGVLRVASGAVRSALSVPWMKLQPTGSSAVDAVDLVKTTNLTPNDVLYVYDLAEQDYRAWKMNENGAWSSLNVFSVDENGQVNWDNPEAAAGGSEVARGLGIWLERANTNDYIYLCGQYDPSSVKTTLAPGFNLVANPYVSAFDASELDEPVKTGDVGDRIVIPTAGAPINAYYKGDAWKWPRSEKVSFENPVNGETVTGTKTVWTSEGLSVPAGLGFWYLNAGSESVELTWPVGK